MNQPHQLVDETTGQLCDNNNCQHEWRVFGTRSYEDVYPVYDNDSGWVVCTKCNCGANAKKYQIVRRQPYDDPLFGKLDKFGSDKIVEVMEWSN